MDIKHGDWFEVGGQVFGPDGAAFDFTGYGIAAQIRDRRGLLVKELTATWMDATQGLYSLVGGNSDEWSTTERRLSYDVQLTDLTGRRTSTRTEFLNIVRDITQ
ncbi:hypothetical protein E5S69_31505 [Cupriavidus necator]|uniref:hypothetical protein n=1 Tax=Cupriavidus necator TaxID=106590 RepID=UPI001490302B|nr:hypothetical protein [Cupriavidus necator]NOV28014.1 hypothetical protein [Cupriavidus necator]